MALNRPFLHRFCLIWLLLASFRLSAQVTRFEYTEPPNQGSQTIQGVENANEFLDTFEYEIDVAPGFETGFVDVVWYNQFGQILNTASITHRPTNATGVVDPPTLSSPTLPMYEGRTQLLSWARSTLGTPLRFTFLNNGSVTINVILNTPTFTCSGGAASGGCTINLSGAATGTQDAIGAGIATNITVASPVPAGTTIGSVNATTTVTVEGFLGTIENWFFGPHVFQQGTDAGEFIFIDSDQGPPDAPFITFFECQGTPTCIDSPLVVEQPRNLLNPVTNRFRYKVVYNKLDIYNATDPAGTGVPLTLRYAGRVQNNPVLWRNSTTGEVGLPGAVPKPESNAFVDSFLFPIRFTNSISPEQAVKTTGTGPFLISVTGATIPGVPQVVYPDNVAAHPYGSPVYPSENPFPNEYPFGPSLSPGRYETFTYNFTSVRDGDYEIWIGAEDVTSTITNNGQSPGEINASGERVAGTTTVIQVIRDGTAPNSFSVQLVPTDRFLLIGDQSDPPLPYTTFQGEIFQVRGTVSDERSDVLTMIFDLRRDDGTSITQPAQGGHFFQQRTTNDFYSTFFDFSNQDPNSLLSPLPPHPATGGQRGYQMIVYPVDPQENVSETTKAIYIVKDLQAPQDPVISEPANGVTVTNTFVFIKVQSPNTDIPAAPFLDLREHGTVNMRLSIIDSAGKASQFTTGGQAIFSGAAGASSKLDDDASWNITPGIFGGNGVTGVDFFGDVPERFEFSQRINLDEFVDGQMTVVVVLTDQVGNPSANTTSITFIKNSTGPAVIFNAAKRQESGPDNNYPVPNFAGADDDIYIVSMISPERVVDFGQGGTAPTSSDPGTKDLLHIEGIVRDSLTNVDRVEVQSPHVPDTLVTLLSPNTVESDFEVDLDVTGVPEGIREVIRFQGFDADQIPGLPKSVVLYRDTTPAEPVRLIEPPKRPTDSLHRIYSATDRLRLVGQMSVRDSRLLSLDDGTQIRSKVVALTPSEAPGSFVTGDIIPRIEASSPQAVPRLDSFFSSFPSSATEAHFDYREVDDDGGFELEVSLANIPSSFTVPTTIYLQGIDQFDNTDPQEAFPVEIFYFPNGGTVATLSLIDFRGSGQDVQVFPPESLPPSILETLFTGIEEVRLRLSTFVPMTQAPVLSLQQFLGVTRLASMVSSVDQVNGQTNFDYTYSVVSQRGKFDGRVEGRVEGGVDLFGNAIRPLKVTTTFYVDSLAPNLVTTPDAFLVQEIQPDFEPTQGQRINDQNIIISSLFTDDLVSNGSTERSGVDTSNSVMRMYGPLSADQESPVGLISVAPQPGYLLSYQVVDPLDDGVYRIELDASDKVGNKHRFYSNFVFDDTPISGPLLITNPSNGSVISKMPTSPLPPTSQYVDLMIERLDADLFRSTFTLNDPLGNAVALNGHEVTTQESRIRKFLTPVIPYDGSQDGLYNIPIEAYDLVGNRFDKVHEFLLDTRAPSIGRFFPNTQTCQSGPLDLVDLSVDDPPGRTDLVIPVAGVSAKSSLRLFVQEPSGQLSKVSSNQRIFGDIRVLSQVESGGVTKVLFLPSNQDVDTVLPTDGSFDGIIRVEASIEDHVGNLSTGESQFRFDNQAPTIGLETFSDGKVLGVTSGFDLFFGGYIQDQGPCHFAVNGASKNHSTTMAYRVFTLDGNDLSRTGLLIATTPITNLSLPTQTSNPYHQSQLRFDYATHVPFTGFFEGRAFEVEMDVVDQAYNRGRIQRIFRLVNFVRSTPIVLEPPKISVLDGVETTFTTRDQILKVRWQAIQGMEEVELEIYRDRLSSSAPIHVLTYQAYLQSSAPISLATGVPIVGKESFRLRIRGRDNQDRYSAFSDFQPFFVDARSFEVESLKLIQGSESLSVSDPGVVILTSQFGLLATLSKKYTPSSSPIVSLASQDQPLVSRIQSVALTQEATNQILFQVKLEFDPQAQFPRKPLRFRLGGLRDQLQQLISGFEVEIPIDLGPEILVQVFSNPVADFELGSVVRFISQKGRLEKVKVIRINNEIVSPSVILRKGSEFTPLKITPLFEDFAQGRLDSFSIALPLGRFDEGFYFLSVAYRDHLGRDFVKEREISLGQYRVNSSLTLVHRSSASRLILATGAAEPGQVYFSGNGAEMSEMRGGWHIQRSLDSFGASRNLHTQRALLSLGSVDRGLGTSHLCLIKEVEGQEGVEFVSRVNQEALDFTVELGSKYFLAQDSKAPVLKFESQDIFLVPGKSLLDLIVQDEESGVDVSSMELKVDGESVDFNFLEQGSLELNWNPGNVRSLSEEGVLEVQVADNAGRLASISKAVQILQGTGVRWMTASPNPVRGSNCRIDYFLEGVADSVSLSVYDSAGRRVVSLDGSTNPGRQSIDWSLSNSRGIELSNGVYFLKLNVRQNDRNFVKRSKLAILR